jgi:hypothetical protein
LSVEVVVAVAALNLDKDNASPSDIVFLRKCVVESGDEGGDEDMMMENEWWCDGSVRRVLRGERDVGEDAIVKESWKSSKP